MYGMGEDIRGAIQY